MGDIGRHKDYLERLDNTELDEYDEQLLNDAQIQASTASGPTFPEFDSSINKQDIRINSSASERTLQSAIKQLQKVKNDIIERQHERGVDEDALLNQLHRVQNTIDRAYRYLKEYE